MVLPLLIGLSEPSTGALVFGDMEAHDLREVFAEKWSLAIADAALRDDEDADSVT